MHGRRAALPGAAQRKGSRPRRALSAGGGHGGVGRGGGLGEYVVDEYVGTPQSRFRMIMHTDGDLNWLQCAPCLDCFHQTGPVFDPAASASYRNVTCGDSRCGLVSPPPPLTGPRSCRRPRSDPCPYYYWYGDQSSTTGDLALEAFTVNLTQSGTRRVDGVAFSAAGSKIIFGHDDALLAHPQLNYTAFAPATADAADTFYYLQLKSVLVGGEAVNIPSDTLSAGGTIIDSGTTLSYFPEPAYQAIRQAFMDRMSPSYPLIPSFPVLSPCYNVSGAEKVEVPELSLVFADGAAWDFPAENYFIRLEPEGVMCLAVLGTPRSGMSIIGNYQQQNFHVLYDLERNRLGFAPRRCADV
ncbi:hypothetical protein ZWY2020_000329 [Hordeum vulgare]|nr:hypothetical protein ZWY2020_000329 [Hordeum vulgare]